MIMISQHEVTVKKLYKNKKDWYIWPGERRTPKHFLFFFFFLRREGKMECLIHFFTSCQPPSALNKSTSGWPVGALKMAATKYFFTQSGKSKQWLLLFLEELAPDCFCDGEISAGVSTHIITCNCNNQLVYTYRAYTLFSRMVICPSNLVFEYKFFWNANQTMFSYLNFKRIFTRKRGWTGILPYVRRAYYIHLFWQVNWLSHSGIFTIK